MATVMMEREDDGRVNDGYGGLMAMVIMVMPV